MLSDLLAQWKRDRLCGTPLYDWCRGGWQSAVEPRLLFTGKNAYTWIDGSGATGAGTEPYLADGGAILWALYTAVLGIRADFQGLALRPHLPRALRDTRVAIRIMGKHVTINYQGCGDRLRRLFPATTPAGARCHWPTGGGPARAAASERNSFPGPGRLAAGQADFGDRPRLLGVDGGR